LLPPARQVLNDAEGAAADLACLNAGSMRTLLGGVAAAGPVAGVAVTRRVAQVLASSSHHLSK
jgi:hypothetical protein